MKAFIRYYTLDHFRLFASKLRLWCSNRTPILVYTMAKVGSMSAYSSIKKQTNIPCFHIHALNLEEDRLMQQYCFDNEMVPDSRSPIKFIQNKLIIPKKKLNVITLFRNPVERNVSAFFDAFELYVGMPISQYKGGVEPLIQLFHEKLPHLYAIDWFDQKFKRDTGIDVYDYEFNQEEGFQYLSKDNFTVLILNSALSNSIKEAQVGKFIQQDSFILKDVNITAESNRGPLYNEFKNTIRFSRIYLDSLLQSKYSQHFFTKDEIEETYNRWLEN